jgi:hypothetical protein
VKKLIRSADLSRFKMSRNVKSNSTSNLLEANDLHDFLPKNEEKEKQFQRNDVKTTADEKNPFRKSWCEVF